MAYIKGVDVARFQSEVFSTSGLSFAFVKATEGTSYVNPRMVGQAAHARTMGLVVGFYHFLHKGNAAEQAAYFVAKAASVAGDILACDWETNPADSTHPTNAEKDAFIKEVMRLRPDHRVILYANKNFWTGIDTTGYFGDGLWIAAPGAAGSPGIKAPWIFHQYSDAGGIDRDVAVFTSKAALQEWAHPTNGSSSMTDAEINKLADAIVRKLLTTDGIIDAPPDAVDIATNKKWAYASHVNAQTTAIRKTAALLAELLAELKKAG